MTEITMRAQVQTSDGGTLSYLYDRDTGSVLTMSSTSYDTTAGSEQSITRGWIVPEQPQGDCVFRECWLQLLYPDGWHHGLTVTTWFDFGTANSVTRSWTSAELDALAVNGRVTVGVNCHGRQARSIKFTVADSRGASATDYMKPLHVTLTYGASEGPRRRGLKAGALK